MHYKKRKQKLKLIFISIIYQYQYAFDEKYCQMVKFPTLSYTLLSLHVSFPDDDPVEVAFSSFLQVWSIKLHAPTASPTVRYIHSCPIASINFPLFIFFMTSPPGFAKTNCKQIFFVSTHRVAHSRNLIENRKSYLQSSSFHQFFNFSKHCNTACVNISNRCNNTQCYFSTLV